MDSTEAQSQGMVLIGLILLIGLFGLLIIIGLLRAWLRFNQRTSSSRHKASSTGGGPDPWKVSAQRLIMPMPKGQRPEPKEDDDDGAEDDEDETRPAGGG